MERASPGGNIQVSHLEPDDGKATGACGIDAIVLPSARMHALSEWTIVISLPFEILFSAVSR